MSAPYKEMLIQGFNAKAIHTYIWDNVQDPKGVVQIFHGMAEHARRYTDFACYLNNGGFIVYADDHRGHGKTAGTLSHLGYIGKDGFNAIVEDEYCLTKLIKNTYPHLPLFIFAHSFGSFIAQEYLTRFSLHIQGIILSGSALQKGPHIKLGAFITSVQHYCISDRSPNYLMEKLCFSSYTNRFFDSNSRFRWLSSDNCEVKKYESDPFCGTVFPVNYYYYLFQGFKTLYKNNKLHKIKKDIPILIISGAQDPVGNYSKSVKKLYQLYKNLNISDVHLKLFPNGRHEMLNEINKDEVYAYLLEWISNHL